MKVQYERLTFFDAYSIAEDIRLFLEENPEKENLEVYFDIDRAFFVRRFAFPHRWTALHEFIENFFTVNHVWGFESYRSDALELVILEYETILKGYDISYQVAEIANPDSGQLIHTFPEEEKKIMIEHLRPLLPIKQIVNETFQLLFGDRGFLLHFNQVVAKFVANLKKTDYPTILAKDGIFRRKKLPVWAKRGIFYRDRGRCIHCRKDLTGTMVTGEEAHYDHIVPLAVGGTNDPTNFQLLCGVCNLKKATHLFTSDFYPVYWNLDEKDYDY